MATTKKADSILSKDELAEIKDEQIRTGQAPIAPGPEEPVDPDDAHDAKQNRGRVLG